MEHSFGIWIKPRRKTLDLKQQELARRIGCSLATIVKIESDKRRPSTQIAHQERSKLHLRNLPLGAQENPPPIRLPTPSGPLFGRETELAPIARICELVEGQLPENAFSLEPAQTDRLVDSILSFQFSL